MQLGGAHRSGSSSPIGRRPTPSRPIARRSFSTRLGLEDAAPSRRQPEIGAAAVSGSAMPARHAFFARPTARRLATRRASTMPAVSARPCQARSNAVPWATLVRTIGRPKRHVHGAVHGQQLDRDVSLIVIHGHHGVELAVARAADQRVGRQRPVQVEPFGQRRARPPGE